MTSLPAQSDYPRPHPRRRAALLAAAVALTASMAATLPAFASGFRDAPAIAGSPKVDGTDFFMFRSYETGRQDYTTLIADYNPLQDPFEGPIYFPLDSSAFYDIHIISGNHTVEDLTFRFRVSEVSPLQTLKVGPIGNRRATPVPWLITGPLAQPGAANVARSYTIRVLAGDIRQPTSVQFVSDADTGSTRFGMPLDNIGTKTIPDYESYARGFIHNIDIPGCGKGKVFVGQRKEPFQGDLGSLFDEVNLPNLLGSPTGRQSNTANKNITSFVLEVPTACLVGGGSGLVSGWTTARLPRVRSLKDAPTYDAPYDESGDYVQVSRVGNPLVSELLIGLPDKDFFNASHPRDDTRIVPYVSYPALPLLIQSWLTSAGVQAPTLYPREDLIVGFMTGIPGLNQGGPQGEVMRLNTLIAPVPAAQQNPLGVVGGDSAGYPNGRRPGDDVVDNSLRVLMGSALPASQAPSGQLPFTDGVEVNALMFDQVFPYLITPLPGSSN
ncbi:MAG TPA: DUF4331 domain-containing protein [Thermoanaerobaculia bacterium]|jgi:hypothetical protein|nr:DUF4331 domain-containing protein [Thermoanaerobaculia bacterium]